MSPDEYVEVAHEKVRSAGFAEAQVKLTLSASRDVVCLDYLEVAAMERRQGIAGRVLRLLTRLSDQTGMTLEVIPHSFDPASLGDAQLSALYSRHGFVPAPSDDNPNLMRRIPASTPRE